MQSRNTLLFIALIVAVVSLFSVDMMVGAVNIPLSEVWKALTGGDCPESTVKIVRNIRLVKAFVALLAGAALSVSGLQMQTLFRNPLAGPYVLGISSGASLGVALVVLAGFGSSFGVAGAAWVGSAVVLMFIGIAARRIKDIDSRHDVLIGSKCRGADIAVSQPGRGSKDICNMDYGVAWRSDCNAALYTVPFGASWTCARSAVHKAFEYAAFR